MSTPTPRTDEAQFIQHDMTEVVSADFARTLERELAAEQAKVRTLREACERLRDCDWVISLPDRMDAVRDIARAALAATPPAPCLAAPKSAQNAPKLNQTGANRPASPRRS